LLDSDIEPTSPTIGSSPDKQRKRTVPPVQSSLPESRRRQLLSEREREILGLLAEGLSGSEIAAQLVLSPETVRTHVRNAMTKLGASTRSQAVALALRGDEIGGGREAPTPAPAAAPPRPDLRAHSEALAGMLDGLVSLYDVEGGALYLADEDGLALRRAAAAGTAPALPDRVALGDATLGQVALERSARVIRDPRSGSGPGKALLAGPVTGGGRLLGVIVLGTRESRPVGRRELLLLHAFAGRVGEILADDQDVDQQLEGAIERFRGSWSGASRAF
jgi:DNA-binding CsgD family transcriptional regulator